MELIKRFTVAASTVLLATAILIWISGYLSATSIIVEYRGSGGFTLSTQQGGFYLIRWHSPNDSPGCHFHLFPLPTATPEQVAGIQYPRLMPYRRMGSRWGETLDVVAWWVVVIPLAVLPVWTGLKKDWERKRRLKASGFPVVQATPQ